MRKFTAALLVAAMTLLLAACGSKAPALPELAAQLENPEQYDYIFLG